MKYFIEGKHAGTGTLAFVETEANGNLTRALDLLARIRSLAEHYRIELHLPSPLQIPYEQERSIDALWALTSGSSFIEDIPGATFECTVGSLTPAASRLLGARRRKNKGSVQIFGTSAFEVLGEVIEVPNVENIFSDVELSEVERVSETSRRLQFIGSSGAKWLRRIRAET